jgi:predicted metallopeptidase
MATYKEVTQEVLHLVEELIAEFHNALCPCKIGLVFRDEAGSSGGRAVFAKSSKAPTKLQPLLQDELDIIIEIAEDKWTKLASEQRRALLDHELCHIAMGSNGWTIRAHDIEEFGEIIQRYGLWNYSLYSQATTLAKAAAQMPLPLKMDVSYTKGSLVALKPEQLEKIGTEA